MKVCIYGAGAIGGLLGAELALSGVDVTLIARGPHLEAIRKSGLTLLTGSEKKVVKANCTDDPASVGPQDFVLLALKTHSVSAVVAKMAPLLGPDTAVVTLQNGIPWWYFHNLPGPWEGHRLKSVDPGGRIWDTLGPERVIGSVVYPSGEIIEPGVIRHVGGHRLIVGEPDGSKSERIVALSEILRGAGFKTPVSSKIRDDIWLKLLGNVSFNPVSVLTHATLEQIACDEAVREVIRQMMTEAKEVARALDVKIRVGIDTRIGWAENVGPHKTSMLQDLERGRPMELDALVAAVQEMGRLVKVPTPTLDVVLALVVLRASLAGRPNQTPMR
ncbi:MAG: 2-dehydropantoate 2-reductase, partial [Acidobacteria bacterium]|nr:2-dehydropantoate 2-reductase [Acidobacteriota bacterium]